MLRIIAKRKRNQNMHFQKNENENEILFTKYISIKCYRCYRCCCLNQRQDRLLLLLRASCSQKQQKGYRLPGVAAYSYSVDRQFAVNRSAFTINL